MATVRELLDVGVARLRESGSESARLDAELLLAHALDTDRTGVLAHTDAPVGDGAAARFEAALDRRATGEPVAYIRGFKEFHGLAFGVDARALIPRPETERLVELAELEVVRRLVGAPRPPGSPPIRVIDVGVGQWRGRGHARGPAPAAGDGRRGRDHGDATSRRTPSSSRRRTRSRTPSADRIDVPDRWTCSPGSSRRHWDVVAANLPYVRTDAIPDLPTCRVVRAGAARSTAAPDGLQVIGRLLDQLPESLADDGVALARDRRRPGARGCATLAAERLPGWSCELEPDLGGLPRVAVLRRSAPSAPGLMVRRVADDPAGARRSHRASSRAGGVIALPTDTVYGIAVALETPGGIERLFAAKSRPPDKAIALLARRRRPGGGDRRALGRPRPRSPARSGPAA